MAQYVPVCTKCVHHNIVFAKPDGYLKYLSVPFAVFQVVHRYLWSPIHVPSCCGNRYVVILFDSLSKCVIVGALPDCSAKSAAHFFVNSFILIHGALEHLITNNGTYFNNHPLQIVTYSMNGTHVFSISYYLQTSGQVERLNTTVAYQIAKFCNPNQTDSDAYHSSVVSTYNTSIHFVNKLTPTNSYLVVHLKIPLILFLPLFRHAPLIFFIVIYIALVALSWFKRKQIPHTPSLVGDTDIIKFVGISTTVLMTLFTYKSVLVLLSLVLTGLDPVL